MATAYNRIHLRGPYAQFEEALASGTVKPGHLLELTDASADTVKAHATAGGFSERAFALEDALQGNDVDDDYSAADRVQYVLAQPGDIVFAWIVAGEDISKGDQLISSGDGTLKETTGTPSQIIAVALEDLDLSASGAVNTRLACRVL